MTQEQADRIDEGMTKWFAAHQKEYEPIHAGPPYMCAFGADDDCPAYITIDGQMTIPALRELLRLIDAETAS